jgi:hypothetical protein
LALLLGAAPLAAQDFGAAQISRYNSASFYRYLDEGELAIHVNVYGSVRFSGYYEIPVGSNLNDLLALTGGPEVSGGRREQDSRRITIRLFRPSVSSEEPVYQIVLEDELTVLPQDVPLEDGDVLTVDSVIEPGFIWRDYLPIGSFAFTILAFVIQLSR